jgi:predicted nuclease of predicted toxin-antitoxin system
MIATKDLHFYRFCVSRGFPPKLVWVRTGNCSIHRLVDAFRSAKERIDLLAMDDSPFLILK